jgi:DNA-binding winged helix-turn-helix (wHTH) protein
MRKDGAQYEFLGVRFLPDMGVIEICETNRKISLSQTHRNLLLALVEKPGVLVTYDELRVRVWPHEPEMSPRVQHTMHVTKGHLIRLLEDSGIKADFIETVPGQGYRLYAEVRTDLEEAGAEGDETGQGDSKGIPLPPAIPYETERPIDQEPATFFNQLFGRHSTYIMISSFLFGLLFWVALLVETAYRFDVYGLRAIWLGFPITVIDTVAAAAAMALAQKRLRERKGGGLLAGLGILIIAVAGSCWLAWLYLPNAPVTLSRFQAQPAFAAFLKNAIIYFLPLGVFFLLMPFYFVVAVELKARKVITNLPADAIFIHPNFLMAVSLGTVIYSLISTFYLLDNLQTGTYHGLFVSLIFMRFIICFGLVFGSMLWYRTSLNKEESRYALSTGSS